MGIVAMRWNRSSSMDSLRTGPPMLIVIGGFAGTGKTIHAHRLSADLRIPRLGSDAIGQMIRQSGGIGDRIDHAFRIGYDLLFGLCEEFLHAGVSTIVDTNMGWPFQWQRLDAITVRHPQVRYVPVILRCPRELCLERIKRRYLSDPINHAPPERFMTERKHLQIWEFLDHLDRQDIGFVDAVAPDDEVYEELRQYLMMRINTAE